MAKTRSVYSYLDKTLQLSLKTFAKQLYNGSFYRGYSHWGEKNRMFVTLNCKKATASMTLFYTQNGVSQTYLIEIIAKPSNLGINRGLVWFFVCPVSGLHCRILYMVNEKFVHRKAYPDQCYYHQTISKKHRLTDNLYGRLERRRERLKVDTIRTYYKGEFTKRFLKNVRLNIKETAIWQNIYADLTARLED